MEADTENTNAQVRETNFSATATLTVRALDENEAKKAARKHFRDTHGVEPSTVLVEEKEAGLGDLFNDRYGVKFHAVVSKH